MKKINYEIIFVSIILVFALFLRIYNLGNSGSGLMRVFLQ